MQRSSRSPQSRKTLGLFTDWLKDPYQNAIANAVSRACAEHDVNLLCFAGGHLDAKDSPWSRRNLLYEFAGAHNLDAVIVMGANVGTLVGPQRLKEYLDQLALPNVISLAYRLEGIPSVLVDNRVGLKKAILHLIDVHGRKNIAMIRGPVENVEAEIRFEVYREALEERGLKFDPRRVMVGDFLRPSGATAMQAILERGAHVDSVLAANDLMALGALDVLRAEGVKVPEEVSVVGFDDVEESSLAIPQLTTIRQSFQILGREAVKAALALFRGETAPSEITVPTRFMVRRSCGCGANAWDETEALAAQVLPSANYEELRKHFLIGYATLDEDGGTLNNSIALELFEAAYAEIDGGNQGGFSQKLWELIRSNPRDLICHWHRVITVIFRALHGWISCDATRRQRAEDIGHQVRASVGDLGELGQGVRRVRAQRQVFDASEAFQALLTTSSLEGVRAALDAHLPNLGIRTGYLSVYEDNQSPHRSAKLIWAINSRDHSVGKAIGQSFETKQLVPFGSIMRDHRESLVIEPLIWGQEQLGVLALAMGPEEGLLYEALREHVSGAIHCAKLTARLAELLGPTSAGKAG